MSSAKQFAANRRNGERGTGPRTNPGKARSSRNALKHGLSAEQVVMLGEDPAAFEALRDDLYAHYQPADPVAINLVEQVAACLWRLRRVPEIEAGIFEHYYYYRQENRARMKKFETFDTEGESEAKGRQPAPAWRASARRRRSSGSRRRRAGPSAPWRSRRGSRRR